MTAVSGINRLNALRKPPKPGSYSALRAEAADLRAAAIAMAQYIYATSNPGSLPTDVRQAMASVQEIGRGK